MFLWKTWEWNMWKAVGVPCVLWLLSLTWCSDRVLRSPVSKTPLTVCLYFHSFSHDWQLDNVSYINKDDACFKHVKFTCLNYKSLDKKAFFCRCSSGDMMTVRTCCKYVMLKVDKNFRHEFFVGAALIFFFHTYSISCYNYNDYRIYTLMHKIIHTVLIYFQEFTSRRGLSTSSLWTSVESIACRYCNICALPSVPPPRPYCAPASQSRRMKCFP